MITEKDNVFYCDCGFSFERGRSGAHSCELGLRKKLAESEAKLAALAAENAGLKKVPATDSETMLLALDAFNTHGSMRPDVGLQQAINVVMQRRETPATDTFLAEVRAQAVEMFAKEMYADISGDDAREFAAQLRKGAAS